MDENKQHYHAALESYEEAKEMLAIRKPKFALLSVRQSLESLVKEICTRCRIELYDSNGKDVDLIVLIDALKENDIISDTELALLHKIRKLGNKGAHVSHGEAGPTMEQAEEAVDLLSQALNLSIEKHDDSKFAEKAQANNVPMRNPDYYSPNRRYYGLWWNCYTREALMVIPEYVNLKEQVDLGDISAMLNLAVGFLPKGIVWSPAGLVAMPKYRDRRGNEYYQDTAYDARYFYWIIQACYKAAQDITEGKEVPQKYIMTALLETVKFHLYYLSDRLSNFVADIDYDYELIYRNQYKLAQSMFGEHIVNVLDIQKTIKCGEILIGAIINCGDTSVISAVHKENTVARLKYMLYCIYCIKHTVSPEETACKFSLIPDAFLLSDDDAGVPDSLEMLAKYASDPVCEQHYQFVAGVIDEYRQKEAQRRKEEEEQLKKEEERLKQEAVRRKKEEERCQQKEQRKMFYENHALSLICIAVLLLIGTVHLVSRFGIGILIPLFLLTYICFLLPNLLGEDNERHWLLAAAVYLIKLIAVHLVKPICVFILSLTERLLRFTLSLIVRLIRLLWKHKVKSLIIIIAMSLFLYVLSELKLKTVDIFDSVHVSIEDSQPNAYLSINNTSIDPFLRSIEFTSDFDKNTNNGDKVTIKAHFSRSEAKKAGYRIKTDTYTYTVTDLKSYLTHYSQLDPAVFEQIEKQAIALALGKTANFDIPKFVSFLDIGGSTFVSAQFGDAMLETAYFYVQKDGVDSKYYNAVNLVIRIETTLYYSKQTLFDGYAYYTISFPNLTISGDQPPSVSMEKVVIVDPLPDMDLIFSAIVDDNKDTYEIDEFYAEGTDDGRVNIVEKLTTIDVFEDVKVDVGGVYPDTCVRIKNFSEDPFIQSVTFTAGSNDNIKEGDVITIYANYSQEDAIAAGYQVSRNETEYVVTHVHNLVPSEDDLSNKDKQNILNETNRIIDYYFESGGSNPTIDIEFDTIFLPNSVFENYTSCEFVTAYYYKVKPNAKAGNADLLDEFCITVMRVPIGINISESNTSTEYAYFAVVYDCLMVPADFNYRPFVGVLFGPSSEIEHIKIHGVWGINIENYTCQEMCFYELNIDN